MKALKSLGNIAIGAGLFLVSGLYVVIMVASFSYIVAYILGSY